MADALKATTKKMAADTGLVKQEERVAPQRADPFAPATGDDPVRNWRRHTEPRNRLREDVTELPHFLDPDKASHPVQTLVDDRSGPKLKANERVYARRTYISKTYLDTYLRVTVDTEERKSDKGSYPHVTGVTIPAKTVEAILDAIMADIASFADSLRLQFPAGYSTNHRPVIRAAIEAALVASKFDADGTLVPWRKG